MTTVDNGLAAPAELFVALGDAMALTLPAVEPAGTLLAVVEAWVFVGLAVFARDITDGRLGGTDAVLPPSVVRLALS